MLLALRIMAVCLLIALAGGVGQAAPASGDLTVAEWVGRDFVFLALPADKQADGYEIFAEVEAFRGFAGDRSLRVPYREHFAKLVTVTKVVPTDDPLFDNIVYLTEKGSGMKLAGRTVSGQLEGLALAEDRELARKEWVGKTVYAKRLTLEGVYDPQSQSKPLSVTVPVGSPLQVVDVWDGLQSGEPVWLVVSVNGGRAALPIAYSWTNLPKNTWTAGRPWQAVLFEQDPHTLAGGSPETWNLIASGAIREGMTKEQVTVSWGPPVRVDQDANGDGASWIYGTTRLRFSGDVLTATEAIPALSAVTP